MAWHGNAWAYTGGLEENTTQHNAVPVPCHDELNIFFFLEESPPLGE